MLCSKTSTLSRCLIEGILILPNCATKHISLLIAFRLYISFHRKEEEIILKFNSESLPLTLLVHIMFIMWQICHDGKPPVLGVYDRYQLHQQVRRGNVACYDRVFSSIQVSLSRKCTKEVFHFLKWLHSCRQSYILSPLFPSHSLSLLIFSLGSTCFLCVCRPTSLSPSYYISFHSFSFSVPCSEWLTHTRKQLVS